MSSFGGLAPSVVPLGLSLALCLACGIPVDDSKYEVVEGPPTPADRIVSAFANGSDRCEDCMRSSCMDRINPCVDTPACTEFATCVQEEGNPAAQGRCASQNEDVTLDTLAAFGDVRACWMASCKAACNAGKNWECLGNYTAPAPPPDGVTVRQTFTNLCMNGDPIRGAQVQYCIPPANCKKRAFTDETGSYAIDLPVVATGPLAGWSGYRWVSDGVLAPLLYRLERNLPIWSDQVESTGLLASSCVGEYQADLDSADDSDDPIDWFRSIAIQFFDCQTAGADGVVLKVTTAPDAIIRYATKLGAQLSYEEDGSSKMAGEGLALVSNLPLGEHELEAYESRSGERIAHGHVSVKAGQELVIYSMFPDPIEE